MPFTLVSLLRSEQWHSLSYPCTVQTSCVDDRVRWLQLAWRLPGVWHKKHSVWHKKHSVLKNIVSCINTVSGINTVSS